MHSGHEKQGMVILKGVGILLLAAVIATYILSQFAK